MQKKAEDVERGKVRTLPQQGNELGQSFGPAPILDPQSQNKLGLSVTGMTKKYGKHMVLQGVSLDVAHGETVGLLGPDGAGKTVSFYCIAGLAQVDSGRILLDGSDVTDLSLDERAQMGLGYLSQDQSIFRGLTVAQNIMAVMELFEPDEDARIRRLDELLSDYRIAYVRDTPARALSGGERRRCEIARAMAAKPSVVLLDDPLAGLDPLSVADIKHAIRDLKEKNVGVLVSDQNVRELLDIVDRAYIIDEGQIIFSGKPNTMIHDPVVRKAYLGEDFET
jgi:lipopolysaccharide export system ATP-binding protein